MKKIYILMATYNGEKYIREQIDSLLSQTYHDWTLIIHDDNSKDATVDIIKDYENKYPYKIKLIDDEISTGGAKENFTYLLNNIDDNYDYIMFCDQDDIWKKDKIEKTLQKMNEEEFKNINKYPIIVFTDLIIVDQKLNVISESMWKYQRVKPTFSQDINRLSTCNVITGCTMMMNKLSIKEYKLTKKALMHDWLLSLQILKIGGKIVYIDEGLILYRQHGKNVSGAKKTTFLGYLQKIKELNSLIKGNLLNYYMLKELNIFTNIFSYTFSKIKTMYLRFRIYE